MMTTRSKELLRLPRPIALLAALLPLAIAAATAARAVKNAADDTYMRRDSFALQHQRDSLVQDARSQRTETMLNSLVRACQKKGECP